MGPMDHKARSGAKFVLVAVSQGEDGHPGMIFTHGLARKSDTITIGIPAHHAEFSARDEPPRIYISDLGGEFEGHEADEMFARLGATDDVPPSPMWMQQKTRSNA